MSRDESKAGQRPDPTAPATDAARGRELVLAGLCHLERVAPDDRPAALELFWAQAPRDEEGLAITSALGSVDGGDPAKDATARRFARRLLEDLVARWDEIDAEIEAVSKRWRLTRMDKIDRNALRLGAGELTGAGKVPRGVVVAEAVRVASRYGSERSGRFVNGVLADIAAARSAAPDVTREAGTD